jgi:hypothetical protein
MAQQLKEEMKVQQENLVQQIRNEISSQQENIVQRLSNLDDKQSNTEQEIINLKRDVDQRVSSLMKEIDQLKSSRGTGGSENATSTNRVKPPEFNGTVSWSVYKRQFEAAAEANRWTTEEKATALILSLRGQASELLQTVSDQQDYSTLVRALELRYGDEHLQEVYKVQLKNRQQKSGETLQELAADIERLTHLAYPTAAGEFLDSIKADIFTDAVRDGELRRAIRISGRKTSSEVLVYALSYEAAKDASRSTHHVRGLRTENCDDQELIRQIRQAVTEEFRQANHDLTGSSRRIRTRQEPKRCWICSDTTHLQRNCPQNQSGNPFIGNGLQYTQRPEN